MKTINIQEQVRLHNSRNFGKGILFCMISAVCWYISYWLVHTLALIPLDGFGIGSAEMLSHVIACAAMGILLFEGFRFGKPHIKLGDIGSWRATGTYGGYEMAKTLGYMYFISQILFCAPRSLIYSMKSFRNIIRTDDGFIEKGNALLERIVENNQWLDKEAIGDEHVLSGLYKMKLIHFREHAGKIEAGLSPKARKLFDMDFPDPQKV